MRTTLTPITHAGGARRRSTMTPWVKVSSRPVSKLSKQIKAVGEVNRTHERCKLGHSARNKQTCQCYLRRSRVSSVLFGTRQKRLLARHPDPWGCTSATSDKVLCAIWSVHDSLGFGTASTRLLNMMHASVCFWPAIKGDRSGHC